MVNRLKALTWSYVILLVAGLIFIYIFPIGGSSYIGVAIQYISVFIAFYLAFRYHCFNRGKISYYPLLMLFSFWSVVSIVRGFFLARGYMDWRFMVITSILVLLIPVIAFIGANGRISKEMFRVFLFVVIPLAALVLCFIDRDNNAFLLRMQRILVPICYFVLMLPFVFKNRHRLIIIAVAAITILIVLTSRSTIARIGAAAVIALLFFLVRNPPRRLLELLRNVVFFVPVVFFALAVTGVFNVFNMNNYVTWNLETGNEEFNEKMKADDRTFLYVEVLGSVVKHGALIFGEGGVAKYESLFFKYAYSKEGGDRYLSETGILNMILFGGIVAVALLGALFYYASRLAIVRSRNNVAKALGLFLAFRWLWMFIEEFTLYDTNYVFLWLGIGLCLSREFRNMTDAEVKAWVNNIFYIKDRYHVIHSGADDRP